MTKIDYAYAFVLMVLFAAGSLAFKVAFLIGSFSKIDGFWDSFFYTIAAIVFVIGNAFALWIAYYLYKEIR